MYWTIYWTMYVFIKNQTNMKPYKEKISNIPSHNYKSFQIFHITKQGRLPLTENRP